MKDPEHELADTLLAVVTPKQRRPTKTVIAGTLGVLAVVVLLTLSVLSMNATLQTRHEQRVEQDQRNAVIATAVNAQVCAIVNYLTDPRVAQTAAQVRLRLFIHCAAPTVPTSPKATPTIPPGTTP